MRKIASTAVLLASFFHAACAFAQSADDRFDAEISQIIALFSDGKIGRVEAARESLGAAKSYFPNDKITHAYYESLLSYAERIESGELTIEQARELHRFRTERYNNAVNARRQEQEQRQAQAEQDERRRREDVARQIEEDRQRAATATFLQNIGRAFREAGRR